MKLFVAENSIVREIWGEADTVLFIFAGAAAEFALNKAVDWLYYTGRLPADPIGRLFSTVTYSRQIIFSSEPDALKAISKIAMIHKNVENNRGMQIPDWAYLDVLYLLINYSIRSYELLKRELTNDERREVFHVFYRVGLHMGLRGLPKDLDSYVILRKQNMEQNLVRSAFTDDLYKQYKKHLGKARFQLLLQLQSLLVPEKVNELIVLDTRFWIEAMLKFYKLSKKVKLDFIVKAFLLPGKYKKEIRAIEDNKAII